MITPGFNTVFVENNVALGNHMFQYAIARLVAHKNGYNFYIPNGHYISKCFPKIDLGVVDGNTMFHYMEDTSSYTVCHVTITQQVYLTMISTCLKLL